MPLSVGLPLIEINPRNLLIMTKLTFDVDFNKDPKEILKEIQERAEAEVAKRNLK